MANPAIGGSRSTVHPECGIVTGSLAQDDKRGGRQLQKQWMPVNTDPAI